MDNFGQSAAELRERDRDRYLADLFAPGPVRGHLFALHAFDVEIASIRDRVSDPMPGEIRLQWWRDVLSGVTGAGGHPVAEALLQTIEAHALPLPAFEALLEARTFDLYDDPMPSLTDFIGYAGETRSAVLQLGAVILAGGESGASADAAGHGGVALALMQEMRRLPLTARRRQMVLPQDVLQRHGVALDDVFAGRATPALAAALAELRATVRQRLRQGAEALGAAAPAVLPAFLPLALVAPYLRHLERSPDPLREGGAGLAQWRRQWLLWRAARRGPRAYSAA